MDLWTSGPTDRREPCGPCGQPVDNADALPTACPHSRASRPQAPQDQPPVILRGQHRTTLRRGCLHRPFKTTSASHSNRSQHRPRAGSPPSLQAHFRMGLDSYCAFRTPSELGEYHWTIDAKDRLGITPWEKWWSTVVLPMLESHSFREPLIGAEGGDYRWQERFRKSPSDYKLQFAKDPQKDEFCDLRMVMTEDFRFVSDPEFGLEAVDIMTNTIRRSLSGNFGREGWMAVRQLMIHRPAHYIGLISLWRERALPNSIPYGNVMDDFRAGGRALLPERYFEKDMSSTVLAQGKGPVMTQRAEGRD